MVVHPDSDRIARVPSYLGYRLGTIAESTGLSPSAARLSRRVRFRSCSRLRGPSTPGPKARFGLFPVRSPLLGESHMMSFPPGTKMFQFPGLASAKGGYRESLPGGFSHSDIHESKSACDSSWLFAACRVLLRRSMPRHPPRALFRLVPNASSARADAVGIPRNRNGPPVRLDRCALHFLSLALLTSNQPPPSTGPAYGSAPAEPEDICSAKARVSP